MVEINLLPWRIYQEEYLKNKNKQRKLAALLFLLCVWGVLHFLLLWQAEKEKKIIHYLHKQVLNQSVLYKTKQIINEDSLQNITEQFQHNRLHLLDFFRQIIIERQDIYWNRVLTQDDQVILTGKTNSYAALLAFIHQQDDSQ